jgi:hypothetical protein
MLGLGPRVVLEAAEDLLQILLRGSGARDQRQHQQRERESTHVSAPARP